MNRKYFGFIFVSGLLQIALFGALALAFAQNLAGIVTSWKIPLVIFLFALLNGAVGLIFGLSKMTIRAG